MDQLARVVAELRAETAADNTAVLALARTLDPGLTKFDAGQLRDWRGRWARSGGNPASAERRARTRRRVAVAAGATALAGAAVAAGVLATQRRAPASLFAVPGAHGSGNTGSGPHTGAAGAPTTGSAARQAAGGAPRRKAPSKQSRRFDAAPFAVSRSASHGFTDLITPKGKVGHSALDILDRMGLVDGLGEEPTAVRVNLPNVGDVTVVARSTPASYTGVNSGGKATPAVDPDRGAIPLIEGIVIPGRPLDDAQLAEAKRKLLAGVRPRAQRSFDRLWDDGDTFTADEGD